MATLDATRREALVSLLDDSSEPVRQALLAYFTTLGSSTASFLREIAHGPASEPADAPRDEGSGAPHPDLVMAY